ncbi:MAG: immunoglobulin domain-containing protein, partial [Oscillospiraceae bacterium]|nr:immunoglobulin domain-containing protein [Oscillospiraceae bacterium]
MRKSGTLRFVSKLLVIVMLISVFQAATIGNVSAASATRIIAQPESFTGEVGDNADFAVVASGSGLTYQWQYSKNGSSWSNVGTSIKSSRTSNVTFKIVAKYDGYQYRCVVTDEGGNVVTSKAATLTVGAALAITAQPADVTAPVGETVKFTVAASGSDLTYQWQYSKNGTTWSNVGTSIAGSKTASMSFKAVEKYNGYLYRC